VDACAAFFERPQPTSSPVVDPQKIQQANHLIQKALTPLNIWFSTHIPVYFSIYFLLL
jgi:hypothetical protein